MVVYVPNSISAGSDAPTLLWFGYYLIVFHHMCSVFFFRIHGGSFMSGSASDPLFNGANLAAATQSIVAVVQYRLGGVGVYLLPCSFPRLLVCSSALWLRTERPTWQSKMSSML